ncbi:MAG TPA: TadE family protein [Vicinamibacterales bacterium]
MIFRHLRSARGRRGLRDASGQSMIEMAMIMPLLVTIALGIIELSYALLDQHVVTKMSREGANLISRDSSPAFAAQALQSMRTGNVDFASTAKVIFTVVKRPSTTGAPNYDIPIVYSRYTYGASVGSGSAITCSACSGNLGTAPDYIAPNSDNNTALRVTGGVPANSLSTGGSLYITEIYSSHPLITPFDRFGIPVPTSLYSIAYF